MMPGLEGTQVCERIRKEPNRPYVYILLLTARTQREDILKGLESGADDYLTKPFDAQELRARLQVGQRILSLQNHLIEAREELLFQATHDALTGLANRGVILEALHRERSRQSRIGGSFGVVLADLDHFKYVNDQHGHLVGDAVLRELARRMRAAVRPYDVVGRYGGEEFLMIVPSSDARGTMGLAERIRKSVEERPVQTDAGEIHMTISLGVAVADPVVPVDAQALLQVADDALYRAKDRGRNRCELGLPADPVRTHQRDATAVPTQSALK
jgi:diguanylate cyclase (GGDEF)-like protein